MEYKTLNYQVEDLILTLTLNRPQQLNAFTVEMANELIHAFNHASEDDDVSAINKNKRNFHAEHTKYIPA